jgi:hypothetical protein
MDVYEKEEAVYANGRILQSHARIAATRHALKRREACIDPN